MAYITSETVTFKKGENIKGAHNELFKNKQVLMYVFYAILQLSISFLSLLVYTSALLLFTAANFDSADIRTFFCAFFSLS